MNDLLASAARALRDMHDGSSPDDASTRRRILVEAASRGRRRRRRRAFAAVWLPLAAVLVASSAWAAVTGRLPTLIALLRGASHETPRETTGVGTRPRGVGPTDANRTPDPPAMATAASDGDATPTPIASAPMRVHPIADAIATVGRASTPAPTQAPANSGVEEALYSAAHHAHFVTRDPTMALRGWDEYLASYPAGRFALEARYNRALALVRLGRTDEARVALSPFADGRSGGYRQAEARSLLDALDAGH